MSGQKIVVESKPSRDGTKITVLLTSNEEISVLGMVHSLLSYVDMMCEKHGIQFDEEGRPGIPRKDSEETH